MPSNENAIGNLEVTPAASATDPTFFASLNDRLRRIGTALNAQAAGWQLWTPSASCDAGMKVSTFTGITGRYLRVGPLVHYRLQCSVTLSATPAVHIFFSAPVPELLNVPQPGNGIVGQTLCACFAQAGNVVVYQNGATPWPNGSYTFFLAGSYQCKE